MHRAETGLRERAIEAAGRTLVASMIAARPFLSGLEGPWIEAMRQRLLDLRVRALVRLTKVCHERGDHGQAARDADLIIGLDPYR